MRAIGLRLPIRSRKRPQSWPVNNRPAHSSAFRAKQTNFASATRRAWKKLQSSASSSGRRCPVLDCRKARQLNAKRRAAEVKLSWPLANMGLILAKPNVGRRRQSFGASPLFRTETARREIATPGFLDRYQGPQFGVAGTRKLCDVYDRPIVGTIIKPSVGMSAEVNRGASSHPCRGRRRLH
jgi:hypothetical protein